MPKSKMVQFRKSINVISNCKECPCNVNILIDIDNEPPPQNACYHTTVRTLYKRILEYYPETKIQTGGFGTKCTGLPMFENDDMPPIHFSRNDEFDIEKNGFPYWCPLERSK